MTDNKTNCKTLTTLSSTPLDRTILYDFRTSYGKLWGDVSYDEACLMISHADALEAAFPHAESRPDGVQDIIDEGRTAEGLLFGYFNAGAGIANDDICDDCRAAENQDEQGLEASD